jgi:C_GCAxxG_C_C family probable redox protein
MVEKIKVNFTEKNLNCAEATLAGANDSLGLGLADDAIKLVGGFGGGFGCGRLCGALAAAITVISKEMIAERAHDTAGLREACAGFIALFEKEFGGTECADLRARLVPPGGRCTDIVTRNAELLEEFLRTLKTEA